MIAAAAACVSAIDGEIFQQQARPNQHGAVIGLLLGVESGTLGAGLLIGAFRLGRIRAVSPARVRTPRASFRRARAGAAAAVHATSMLPSDGWRPARLTQAGSRPAPRPVKTWPKCSVSSR